MTTTYLDAELANELENLALGVNLPATPRTTRALEAVVIKEQDFREKVEAGLADLAAGRLIDHDAVVSRIRRTYRLAE